MSLFRAERLIWVPTLTSFLAGCAGTPVMPFLSTAASLQIDVEVYKGPLALNKTTQWGELLGTVGGTLTGLSELKATIDIDSLKEECGDNTDTSKQWTFQDKTTVKQIGVDVDDLITEAKSIKEPVELIARLWNDANQALSTLNIAASQATDKVAVTELVSATNLAQNVLNEGYTGGSLAAAATRIDEAAKKAPDPVRAASTTASKALRNADPGVGAPSSAGPSSSVQNQLLPVVEFATHLQDRAAYWSTARLAEIPKCNRIRILIARFASLTSEYGNQIDTRVDVLTKGVSPERMATGDYLRNAAPTGYLNLYDWFGATVEADHGAYPATHDPPHLAAPDRVRAAQQLFADKYWTKVNEVYASGQGKIRMALIKDDIGNWNLKSFDSDPESLLKAYRDMTLAGVKLATTAATAGGSSNLLEAAANLSRGHPDAKVNAAQPASALDSSRADTLSSLRTIVKKLKDSATILDDAVKSTQAKIAPAQAEADAKTQALKGKDSAVQDLNSKISEAHAIGATDVQILELQTQLKAAETEKAQASDALAKSTVTLRENQKAHSDAVTAQTKARDQGIADAQREIAIYQRGLEIAQRVVQSSGS